MTHFGFPLETLIIFFSTIIFSIYIDLVMHKNSKEISLKNATLWSIFWIMLALGFYLYLYIRFDKEWADLYLAGYILEKSLSIDNLMVFVAIFSSFGIRNRLQHKILYWGILGALIFRAIFVLIGTELFNASPYVGFIFAVFVIWTGFKMLHHRDDDTDDIENYAQHWSVRWLGKICPIYTKLYGNRFVIRNSELKDVERHYLTRHSACYITPALLCLIVIETSDIAFAFDSVPAVIAVTQESLLVYASMIFAILGLRSLYFVLTALTKYLIYLDKAVIVLLFFIGIKMGIQSWNHAIGDSGIHISAQTSLFIVLGVLGLGIISSIFLPNKNE